MTDLVKRLRKQRTGFYPVSLMSEAADVLEQQAKRIEELEEENSDLKSLLRRAGDCPTCDGSGTYYTSTGAEAQCQYSYERNKLTHPEDKEK